MEECTLILVSNAEFSRTLYPSNTVAKFTTRLFEPVEMNTNGGAAYEIAVTKIQFPISFYNVNDTDYYIHEFKMDNDGIKSEIKTLALPKGNYADLTQFLDYLNKLTIIKNNLSFQYNEESGRVEVSWNMKSNTKRIDLSPKLRAMLGFDPTPEGPKQCFIREGPAPSPPHLHVNVHQQLFVYCDVVEPQLVGDSSERVLCTVGIEDVTKFGYLFKQRFPNPDYVPLLKTTFHTIEIDIRTYEDLPAPFEFGPSLVKVHIRRALRSRRRQ
jgi:hypothetical protein